MSLTFLRTFEVIEYSHEDISESADHAPGRAERLQGSVAHDP